MFKDELTDVQRTEITSLLKESGSLDKAVALEAQKAIAQALEIPLRQGLNHCDIVTNIFTRETFDPAARIEYPIDFFRPDNVSEFVAYTIPNQGRIPEKHIEGDYVTVPTFDVGSSVDWLLKYAREARWDIVSRAMEVMEAGFVKKTNDDGWHTLLTAGFDRNLLVNDENASAGQFTKRLVSLMKLTMRRNAGGNTSSINRGKLTHMFLSPEAMEDIRNWGIDGFDELTRREIYVADDGAFNRVFNVNLVDLDELGEGQEYQEYYENVPADGAANDGMAAGDVELVVGMDLGKNDSFVMPVRQELQIFVADDLHRQRRAGFYGWAEHGFAVLNNVRLLLGSL